MCIEVIASDRWSQTRETLNEYFAVGVFRVVIVEMTRRVVLVFSSPNDSIELRPGDTFRGEGILEGFEADVSFLLGG